MSYRETLYRLAQVPASSQPPHRACGASNLFRRLALIITICAGVGSESAYGAQLVTPFYPGDVTGPTAEEFKEIREAVDKVLQEYKVGALARWSAPTTGRAGQVVLKEIYENKGMKCATVVHRFTQGTGRTISAPL